MPAPRRSVQDSRERLPHDFEHFRGQCRGKVPHTSKKLANGARRVMLKHGARSADRLQSYKCPQCHHWHNGNDYSRRFPIPIDVAELPPN